MERRITHKPRKNTVAQKLEQFLNQPIASVSGATVKVTLEDGTCAQFIYDGEKVITSSSSGTVTPKDSVEAFVQSFRGRNGGGTEI